MAKYIDREALIQELDAKLCALHGELDENRIVYDAFTDGFEECVGEVGKFQFAEDVAPMVHGTWRYDGEDWFCSRCNHNALGDFDTGKYDLSRFCPNCGAKMDGDNNG